MKRHRTASDTDALQQLSLSDRSRFLALASAEIMEFRPTGPALLFYFQFCNAWRMQRKYPLHAFPVRDPAYGESFVQAAALAADHDTGEDLDPFLVAFHDPRVHAYAVANRKRREVTFLLLLLNIINDLVHNTRRQPRGCGRTLSFECMGFATRNRGRFYPNTSTTFQEIVCENVRNLC
jgi:hypothetical protein